jgi:hypothetical protein
MYLDDGFEKFGHAHGLEVRCLLLCHYEGDGCMRVSVFDGSSYRRHYHNNDSGKGSEDSNEDNDGHL